MEYGEGDGTSIRCTDGVGECRFWNRGSRWWCREGGFGVCRIIRGRKPTAGVIGFGISGMVGKGAESVPVDFDNFAIRGVGRGLWGLLAPVTGDAIMFDLRLKDSCYL